MSFVVFDTEPQSDKMPAETTTLQEFESVYPKLQAAILDHAKSYKLPQGEMDWFKLVCDGSDPALG